MIKSGFLVRDNFTLHYKIQGFGEPVIVVGSSIYYPKTFSHHLEKDVQMIYIDHRGFAHAKGEYNNDSFALEKLIDDIEALRSHLNLNKITILGHSGHGYIALEYAKKYPNFVSHVVLVALSPDSKPENFIAADQYFADSVCPERKKFYYKNMAQLESDIAKNPERRFIWYSLRSGARIWYDYKYNASYLWKDVPVIPEMFDYVWGEVFKSLDITKNLEKLHIPVLVMLGRYDYWNPPYLWNAVRSKFNDLTISVFEKSGHTPQLEEASSFNRELLHWLKSKI